MKSKEMNAIYGLLIYGLLMDYDTINGLFLFNSPTFDSQRVSLGVVG